MTAMQNPFILYGMGGSLYTAKVRAYLRKRKLNFVERPAGGDEFKQQIVPKVGRWIIPVVVTPEGAVLQDGSAIIDTLEARYNAANERGPSVSPDGLLGVLSHVFALFGSEGMLRPAMHYRWNFDDDNLAFLLTAFEDVLPAGLTDEDKLKAFLHSSGRMRKAGRSFGVESDTFATIESSYLILLSLLEAHFKTTPFLLGGYPTLGDYGLLGPLYPHLGRDPHPSQLMQRVAPHVCRWVERMNAPEEIQDHIAASQGGKLFPENALPSTLLALLGYVAEDYLPELSAHVDYANEWLAERKDLVAGSNGLDDPAGRSIGLANFNWRGHSLTTVVMPYRFYLLQRIQDAAEGLTVVERSLLATVMATAGLTPLIEQRVTRRVIRDNNLEVWQ